MHPPTTTKESDEESELLPTKNQTQQVVDYVVELITTETWFVSSA